jgi:hypothetical protein
MTMLSAESVDRSSIQRIAASGGYALLAQHGWISQHLARSLGREAFYCRGVGAPMRNVPSGAPVFCVETGETPHRVHLWGSFAGWEELPIDAAWNAHGERLGASSVAEWRRLISKIPSLKHNRTVGLIRLESIQAPSSPIALEPLGIEIGRGAMKGRSLSSTEVVQIFEAAAAL